MRNKETTTDSSKEKLKLSGFFKNNAGYKIAILALTAVVIAGGIFVGINLLSTNKTDETSKTPEEVLGLTDTAAMAVNDTEKQELVAKVDIAMQTTLGRNLFLNVKDGEDTSVTVVYNKDEEVFSQASETGYITVYRKDGKAVRYTDYIDFGYDSDVLHLLENVSLLAKEGKATVLKEVEADKVEGYSQIIIDVRGWDSIAELYNKFDKSFSTLMVEQLKSSISEIDASGLAGAEDTSKLNFRFAYIIDDKTNIVDSASCYLYFGDKDSDKIQWKELAVSWAYGGYREVYDWKLDESWYSVDWENMDKWEDTEEAETMLSKLYTELSDMIDKYAVDNGLEKAESSSSSSSSEETESSLSESSEASESSESTEEKSTEDISSEQSSSDKLENEVASTSSDVSSK